MMMNFNSDDYGRIERAILFLDQNAARQPGLDEIAREIHLSEFHFQRLFKRWAGISPKRFLQILTVEVAKARLIGSRDLLNAAWDVGLSGPGRLHDHFVSIEAVTPGEFKTRGAGLQILYGFHATPFGKCLIGLTERGICHLAFIDQGVEAFALDELRIIWPAATLTHSQSRTAATAARAFTANLQEPLRLLHSGTNFQAKVWNALLNVPSGATTSYEQLAEVIGQPKAARAVGQAVAHNSIAYLIPCHRVIRKLGRFGHYRWGPTRKRIMLAWESAQRNMP
jgi:AraC family transcriptional regulator of adaptative response/methylated-DNA-[protein]-cysteine methyltransferase